MQTLVGNRNWLWTDDEHMPSLQRSDPPSQEGADKEQLGIKAHTSCQLPKPAVSITQDQCSHGITLTLIFACSRWGTLLVDCCGYTVLVLDQHLTLLQLPADQQ